LAAGRTYLHSGPDNYQKPLAALTESYTQIVSLCSVISELKLVVDGFATKLDSNDFETWESNLTSLMDKMNKYDIEAKAVVKWKKAETINQYATLKKQWRAMVVLLM
jgi:hypothetical protein